MRSSQVVVVTGASAGVGRATALQFARQGAKVALLARDKTRLQSAQAEIQAAGGQALIIALDVADAAQVEAAAAQVEQELGAIDVWVNNAMVTIITPVHDLQADEVRRVTEVTYLGTVHGTLAALKRMRECNRGVIVQVGSALAYRAIPVQSAYCAAKFAVRGFTDSLRTELLHQKSAVRITMVQLPAHNTPQFDWARHRMPARPRPVAPVFRPEVAARAITWAAQGHRREVWLGFSAVKAIVGTLLAPALADRLAASAWDGQMDQSAPAPDPHRADNLFRTVVGNQGVEGRFGDEAKATSWQFRATQHRAVLGAMVLGVAALAALVWM
ncbi:MAG: SDR family oxidoreductase [Pseudohongiella sp.]|nr:SDR family oxidoreductase [Pseudohongiella sp.]